MSADSHAKAAENVSPDPASAMMSFWVKWMEQASNGSQTVLEAMQSAGDPNQLQQRWAAAMSESAESFLRTPAFMEVMRQNLKAITDMKRMQDNIVKDAARHLGMPLAEDITGLFDRLNSTEQKILKRLDAIEEKLQSIEANSNESSRKRSDSDSGASQGQHGEAH
jgi:hypothetical protein